MWSTLTDMKIYKLSISGSKKTQIIIYNSDTKDKVEGKAWKAIQGGKTVTWMDGTRQWIEEGPIVKNVDDTWEYIWHPDGNRIKCEVILETTPPNGAATKTVLRTKFVDFIKAFN